ncbi:MAG TPA: STAS domain-containing protein [Baekduia sp.]|uniref:STAS domain-containing protein n=1 Tax=Baekduia sp. TaxID=2600305 RepID=UPI002D062F9B|nr:STAS domain-containing protein [Baekduia sp.]HMJ35238.1 STAS domain-containing protein [Baekduia sp.]
MLPPEDFTITVGRHRETVTVALAGELDLASAPLLGDHLTAVREERPGTLMLDLGEVTFMDSSGVVLLLSASRHCERDGVTLVISHVPPAARRVLEVCGVVAALPLAESEASGPHDLRAG